MAPFRAQAMNYPVLRVYIRSARAKPELPAPPQAVTAPRRLYDGLQRASAG